MNEQHFNTVIKPKSGWFDLHLKEVFAYRDLIFLFVKRNFVSKYKQTVLGRCMGDNSAAFDNGCFHACVRKYCGVGARRCAVVRILSVGNGTVDVFFKLPHTNGEYLCCQQRNNGQSVFSPACNAYFNGFFRAHQPCDSICVFDYLSRLLCSSKTRGAA